MKFQKKIGNCIENECQIGKSKKKGLNMGNEVNIAKIEFTLENGKKIIGQLQFSNSQLIITDGMMKEILVEAGFKEDTIVGSCNINLGANNIAVNIVDYSLTDTLYFSALYNMPSNISIFQSHGTNVHIANQKIDLLQLDCQNILLAECQVRQLDVGLVEHSKALAQTSKVNSEAVTTAYKMKSLDLRGCHISSLKGYVECDNVNIQESSIRSLCFIGGFGSAIPAIIKRLNIWNYSDIGVCEIHCAVWDFTIKDSAITTFVAKAKCCLSKLMVSDTEILNAHNFEKKHFVEIGLDAWSLISKSAGNDKNSGLKAEADYQIVKAMYKQEKGINRITGSLFGLCTGYGYKPMKILLAFIVLIFLACITFSVNYCLFYKCCIPVKVLFNYLVIAVAAIAGQSGLVIADGFDFWVATSEYLLGVILFAMFVNALYVRYKE